ncbi:hypothetical protein AB434_2729 [Heyndrickxia coagulans]|uniref:Uncharacterized protein n=1 Tax=Heyndrickxia coagulans TaxID=1398 RepID=A0AAN0T5L0_HEYCO|nr:hypothetical protein SB48_HM08orf04097 [Heyndrickxia coagulans]AKN55134.1 hypothetical protein AB434_2729 [Heyndrickxia coagulans]
MASKHMSRRETGFRLAQAGAYGYPDRRKKPGWRVCPGRFTG